MFLYPQLSDTNQEHIQLRLSHLFRAFGRPRISFHEKHNGPTYTVTRDASMFCTRNQIRGRPSPLIKWLRRNWIWQERHKLWLKQ